MRTSFCARGYVRSWRVVWALFLVVGIAAAAAPASAQNTAAFTGTVVDDTGGVLPGITVTLSGEALIGGPFVAVTGGDGIYRHGNLPGGLYELLFELPGFRTVVRDNLRLTVGFTAEIDVTMEVGAVEETITVSGEAPVVDIQQTATSIAVTRELIEAVPRGRGLMDAYIMTPGVITAGAPAVGDSNMVSRRSIINYGVRGQPKLMVEGINITTGPDANSGVYVSNNAFEELEIKASGNDAEVMTPGISMVAVIKSGGNQFHGSAMYGFQNPGFQANNIDATVQSKSLQKAAPLRKYYEWGLDIGGRIIPDKFWFYAALDKQVRVDNRMGFRLNAGADGYYRTADDPYADYEAYLDTLTYKLTGQVTQNNKLLFVYQTGDKIQPTEGGGPTVPMPTIRDYRDETGLWKVGYQATPNTNTFIESNYGWAGYFADHNAPRANTIKGQELYGGFPGHTTRRDFDTGFRTGEWERSDQRPRGRLQWDSSVSILAGANHEMKVGGTIYWEKHSTGVLGQPSGNYQLRYDGCVGPTGTVGEILPDMSNCTPDAIAIFNYPVAPSNYSRTHSMFIKDTWRASDRLTLNLGVRWDKQRSYLRDQSFGGSAEWPTVFPAVDYPGQDINIWTRAVPRIGMAYDLTGDGSTLVKGTFGLFNHTIGESFAGAYNRSSRAEARFNWTDSIKDNDYTAGEVDLDLNGPDFITITAASNTKVNKNLEQPLQYEATFGIERELLPALGMRVMYVDKARSGYFSNQNVARPYAAYNVIVPRRDPGPDGKTGTGDDGQMFNIYDYPASLKGGSHVSIMRVNSDVTDKYRTIEFTLTKRASARWSAIASLWHTWENAAIDRVPDNPNNEYNYMNTTTSWNATGSFVYNLPAGVTASLQWQSRSGVYGQRTVRFTKKDPLGGASLNENYTVRVTPFGSHRSGTMNILSLRGTKAFDLGGGARAALNVDGFNILNSNAATRVQYASGGAFGEYRNILAPRIMRLSFDFRF